MKAKSFFKSNFNEFVMLLCGGIVQFHYQKIIQLEGKSCRLVENLLFRPQLIFALPDKTNEVGTS